MINNTRSLHDEKVKSLADKYTNEGFRVLVEPKKDELPELPFDLGNYLPDILAIKNESGLIIEVKTSLSRVSVDNLQAIANKISRHPGWRFLLVTLEDIEAESLPGLTEQLPSWQELIDYLSQTQKLIESNEIEPAYLFLWSIFEGALRKRAVEVSIPVERLPLIKLLKQMYSLGELSISQSDTIQACLKERNRLAHGYIQKLNWEVLLAFVNLVFTLLNEWIPNISENQKIAVLAVVRQTIASMTKNINETTAQRYQTVLEIVASVLNDETIEKKHKILAAIQQRLEQEERGTNYFNDLQHIVEEYCDPSIESNNQQLKKNQVVLLDKAQIAIDALPTQDQGKISHAISCLEKFPDCSEVEVSKLSSIPNYFIAKVGIYRIIFEVKSEKLTIIDIVNFNRIEMLYGSLEKAKI
ncbi:hypothetical protein A0J48_010050 [Sphaerospermopsis aphanizomenoides BCCUSP55]|uniref:hypothetical protein n=1 Tax=Sphaerospermopsis aphanizomenoides TaxID=459663 RepID=UPI00190835A4|nr:hypothetical protein [Sphaerospermopsis aphanizomenoides]MBK1987876.1 hypothetical protein [Sphaerospermopsis aphanizomenoides BCCUSP55]